MPAFQAKRYDSAAASKAPIRSLLSEISLLSELGALSASTVSRPFSVLLGGGAPAGLPLPPHQQLCGHHGPQGCSHHLSSAGWEQPQSECHEMRGEVTPPLEFPPLQTGMLSNSLPWWCLGMHRGMSPSAWWMAVCSTQVKHFLIH